MKKNIYISAMDKTVLDEAEKEKLKALYDAANNPKEEKIMTVKEKRIRKPLAVAAASLALLIGFGAFSLTQSVKGNQDNSFVLKVNAAELKEGKAVLADTSAFAFSVSEGEDNLDHYSIDFPIKYEGDNIESITYKLNKGAFEIFRFDENRIDLFRPDGNSGEKSDTEIQENIDFSAPDNYSANVDSEYGKLESSYDKTKKFTVSYDDQNNAGRYINIAGDSKHLTQEESAELKKTIYGSGADAEQEKAVLKKLLGNLVITSTINFKDGTVKTQDIKVGTKIIKNGDATTDEVPPEKEGDSVVFSFELA